MLKLSQISLQTGACGGCFLLKEKWSVGKDQSTNKLKSKRKAKGWKKGEDRTCFTLGHSSTNDRDKFCGSLWDGSGRINSQAFNKNYSGCSEWCSNYCNNYLKLLADSFWQKNYLKWGDACLSNYSDYDHPWFHPERSYDWNCSNSAGSFAFYVQLWLFTRTFGVALHRWNRIALNNSIFYFIKLGSSFNSCNIVSNPFQCLWHNCAFVCFLCNLELCISVFKLSLADRNQGKIRKANSLGFWKQMIFYLPTYLLITRQT